MLDVQKWRKYAYCHKYIALHKINFSLVMGFLISFIVFHDRRSNVSGRRSWRPLQELKKRWDNEREHFYDDIVHVEASANAHWTNLLISTITKHLC